MKTVITAFAFLLCLAAACGDNTKPPMIDSDAPADPVCPPVMECPMPPPDEVEEECYFVCRHFRRAWKCTEVCECDAD